ncbi:MAG: TetR/AcrR family transcriptional regulator [Calditrichaeota bacterium]|nr:MAG: TetR/AcrR family transcriptional regulator [Calditrichota bacterium]
MNNSKHRQIIVTAKKLFWQFGVRRVSIEEICTEANVSKMTFYKHFRNKLELAKFILKKMTDEGIANYQEIMAKDISFREKVRQTIELKLEQTNDLSQAFFADIHNNKIPELKAYFDELVQFSIKIILDDYTAAQKRGEIRKNVKPEFIMYFLNQLFVMTEDENLQKLYKQPQALIMELTNFFFYGILERDCKVEIQS